jgi:hypothetical protein
MEIHPRRVVPHPQVEQVTAGAVVAVVVEDEEAEEAVVEEVVVVEVDGEAVAVAAVDPPSLPILEANKIPI